MRSRRRPEVIASQFYGVGEPPTANIPPWGSRAAGKYTISIRLRNENAALSPFEVNYLNIATWVTVDE